MSGLAVLNLICSEIEKRGHLLEFEFEFEFEFELCGICSCRLTLGRTSA